MKHVDVKAACLWSRAGGGGGGGGVLMIPGYTGLRVESLRSLGFGVQGLGFKDHPEILAQDRRRQPMFSRTARSPMQGGWASSWGAILREQVL